MDVQKDKAIEKTPHDYETKYLATKEIRSCKVKRVDEILTQSELLEMVRFFHSKYGLEELAKMKFKDCRKVHINLGFL